VRFTGHRQWTVRREGLQTADGSVELGRGAQWRRHAAKELRDRLGGGLGFGRRAGGECGNGARRLLAALGVVCVVFNGGRQQTGKQSRILFFPVFITPPTYSGPHRVSETSAHGDVSLGSCGGDLSVGTGPLTSSLPGEVTGGALLVAAHALRLCRRRA
jgi:hypothetical protein